MKFLDNLLYLPTIIKNIGMTEGQKGREFFNHKSRFGIKLVKLG